MTERKTLPRTERLREMDRNHVWHPFTQMKEWFSDEPLMIERGKGNYLYDTDGNKYLDAISSLWVTVHGHRKRELNQAVKEQLGKLAHSTLLGQASAPSAELASRLADITPRGLSRVFYSDSGSTAVEIALKIAYQYWTQKRGDTRREKFVSFTGAYHGDTIGSMSVGEIDAFVGRFSPLLFESLRAPYPYCYRCPVGKDRADCKLACLDELEKVLKENKGRVAACIIEPMVQGAAGMVTAPEGFLKGARRLTKKYDTLLIADEVATGFGRTGRMFACEVENVRPDIICLAKGITGGYLPLAATMTTEKIFKAFLGKYEDYKAFLHGHTYTGNPLACAAAIANLDVFENEKVIENLGPKAELFGELAKGLEDLPHVGEARTRGLMGGIELVKDKETKERYPAGERIGHKVCMDIRDDGIILRPLGDTIIVMPPLSITEGEIKKIFTSLRASIERITDL